jgi:ribosomal protein L16 Arg81 hydroxylase
VRETAEYLKELRGRRRARWRVTTADDCDEKWAADELNKHSRPSNILILIVLNKGQVSLIVLNLY